MRYGRALAVLSLGVLSACESNTQITPPALDAPTSLAINEQMCSGAATEFFNGTSWVPAYVATYYYPWITPLPGSSWLTVSPDYQPDPGTYHFRQSFTLPGDSKNLSLNGYIHADNQAILYLNGTEVFRQPSGELGTWSEYPNYQNPADLFSIKTGFVNGAVNTLAIDVVNWGTTPNISGLDFCASLQYASQSADTTSTGGGGSGGGTTGNGNGKGPNGTGNCPSARSIANKILTDLKIKGKQADRILTEVSHHQTTESDFDGIDKCEPLFAAVVKNFVMALVATL